MLEFIFFISGLNLGVITWMLLKEHLANAKPPPPSTLIQPPPLTIAQIRAINEQHAQRRMQEASIQHKVLEFKRKPIVLIDVNKKSPDDK